jgi:uncharacterized alpha-E superfamily protein
MMLSRVADDLFWTARYLERGADIVRLLEISYLIDLDRPENVASQWEPLAWITGDMPFFQDRYGQATRENVMRFLVVDTGYDNSVVSCLAKARTNAKGLREQIPAALWEEINVLWRVAEQLGAVDDFSHLRILDGCREISRLHTLIQGLIAETMTRGEGYHLWQLGTHLERADKTSRMVHVKYFHLLPKLSHVGTIIDDAQWSALLQSLGAREDYHRQHGLITSDKVIDAIVCDPRFPRSIMFCLNAARENLLAMPDGAQGRASELLNALCERVGKLTGAEIIAIGVHQFINQLQIEMNAINIAIIENIFPPIRPTVAAPAAAQEISQ